MIRRLTTSRKQKGFTLIEAVVATGVFAFVVSSILGTYIAVLRLDTRTRAQRTVSRDARFLMEYLGKEIRNGRIDYASYPNGLTCGDQCGDITYTSDLYLINQNNEAERFYFWDRTANQEETGSEDCLPVDNVCDLRITKSGNITTTLNSPDVKVTRLKFFAAPWGDPFTNPAYNQQPNVTVVIELVANFGTRDAVKINLETTFSTLYYPPRP